jgi:hypothetical protein
MINNLGDKVKFVLIMETLIWCEKKSLETWSGAEKRFGEDIWA